MPARAKKEKPAPAPDDLVRQSAGVYKTGDGRFEVQKSDVGWYLVDTEQANEFGQQLIHGPLATLDAIRDAIPGARDIKPLLRVRPTKASRAPASSGQTKPEPPPPPPPTWIDQLPAKEATEVRQLIRALEKEGLKDAEELVRRHRADTTPTIATRLLEHRLSRVLDEAESGERDATRRLIGRVVEELTVAGAALPRPLPRWALVELGEDAQSPRNRLRPRVDGS